jgi:exonuclease III
MAGYNVPTTTPSKVHVQMRTQPRCLQLNLQHSRLATDNLNKITEDENIDILCIQEPYEIRNKIVGLSRRLKIFTAGEGKHRAAILVNNKLLDTILLKQLSDEDAVVIELILDNKKAIIASMYSDITQNIDIDLRKIEEIIQHAHDAGILIVMDSNARSSSWHDILTNGRGRTLEEFLTSRQLYIMNEESYLTTFWSSHGKSNIDLTITNHRLLSAVVDWEICDQESCSDHSVVRYNIRQDTAPHPETDTREVKFQVRKDDKKAYQQNLIRLLEQRLTEAHNTGDAETLDKVLCTRVTNEHDIERLVEEFYEVLEAACRSSFGSSRATNAKSTHKTVPW